MNEQQTYTILQMADEATKRQVLSHMNTARSGGFACVHGYEKRVCKCKPSEDGTPCQNPDHIEIADHYVQFGVSYASIRAKDIVNLKAILAGDKQLSVTVKYGVWMDADGVPHNVKAKGRVPMKVEIAIDMSDERLRTAVEDVLDSLEHPKQAAVDYTAKAKGTYEYDGKFYIRDALAVHKVVRQEAEYPFSASSQEVAIKDAVKRTLITGKYRAFVFDGRFDFITVSGRAIMVDGMDESLYFIEPELAKSVINAPALVE